MKWLLALLVFGVRAFGGTIPVTGGGSFNWDYFNGLPTISLGFIGSDGTDSVSFFAQGIPSPPMPEGSYSASTSLYNPILSMYTQTVDGIHSNYYVFSLGGGGPQYLTLLDASGNVLISQAIQGYIQTIDYEQPYGPRFLPSGQMNLLWQATGKLLVTPVPEASSGILLCIGICCMVLTGAKEESGRLHAPLGPYLSAAFHRLSRALRVVAQTYQGIAHGIQRTRFPRLLKFCRTAFTTYHTSTSVDRGFLLF